MMFVVIVSVPRWSYDFGRENFPEPSQSECHIVFVIIVQSDWLLYKFVNIFLYSRE